ncbi:glycosyltransferase family 2 protein [Leptothoe spongobia]|uniref:Glycosyltransferase n=1 Tax=Leptothoe spongobia TAU-MAC 1115 TaxID=1967444 RepID=A0A947DCP9_9CYAN|nr:glycosyltransferase family 2 protein [Leptothoe spongobia]MBT9314582.1 glycosyltransferase [Leptothoe spongobia TAU-MAC 1115]
MRVSVVTISFNQADFLEKAILSVLDQDYGDLEYIVVDPGSTDGSRDIIEKYSSRISKVVLEPDKGPADGLNKGFQVATGDILGFLNSDDLLLPGAVTKVVNAFKENRSIDVISGHTTIIDESDNILRLSYSDNYSAIKAAYKAAYLMQPSTFFKADKFLSVGGFNPNNRSNWDGELWLDLYQSGASFLVINKFLSSYRLTGSSITGSKKIDDLIKEFNRRRFEKVLRRSPSYFDIPIFWLFKLIRFFTNPGNFYQKILNGKVYGRKVVTS